MDRRNVATRGRVPSWNTLNYCSRGSFEHMLASRKQSEATSAIGSSYSSDIQHKAPCEWFVSKERRKAPEESLAFARSRRKRTLGWKRNWSRSPIVGEFLERFASGGAARRSSQRSSANDSEDDEDEDEHEKTRKKALTSSDLFSKIKRVGSSSSTTATRTRSNREISSNPRWPLETLPPFEEREKVLKSEAEKALRGLSKG